MLPLFPLQLVVYPGERIPLHIFEDRYQQLIIDCESEGISFGIPSYIDKKMEYGTEVELKKVVKKYPNGESDIICVGKRIFRIQTFYPQLPGKLYAGGDIEYLEDNEDSKKELQEELQKYIASLYVALLISNPPIYTIPFRSFQVAHKIGLSLNQEYHLLTLRNELDRINFLIAHLKITIPIVKEMNRAKAAIKMNGHFKNFDPIDFQDFKM